MAPRLRLAHLPTPLWRSDALDELIGARVWVKRDDMTAGAEAGNKIRKLEYLLADALEQGASTVITCGGEQSNHARATALLCAQLGLSATLFLRTTVEHPKINGNLLLDRLAGAEVRFITPDDYRRRAEVMAEAAAELSKLGHVVCVIPEGGSNGLGSLGYVDAMREVRQQLDLGLAGATRSFDAVVTACGSGGTAAGLALGARHYGVAPEVHAMAVCDNAAYFESVIGRIVLEAIALDPSLDSTAQVTVHDAFKGPSYAIASEEQRRFIVDVAKKTGLVLDPVYTGKALYGLAHLDDKPDRVLFIHTGGLPGLLAQSKSLRDVI
jgi:D-cysteine desulfhydrase